MAGELDELRVVYERFHKQVLAVCYHYTNSIEEAEEIMQESFVRFYQATNRPSLADENHLKRWLFRVAINISFDRFRGLKRFVSMIEQALFPVSAPRDQLSSVEDKSEIMAALGRLDARSRMVVILRYMEDMEISEIAEVTGINENSVKSLLSRAIKKMSKEEGYGQGGQR